MKIFFVIIPAVMCVLSALALIYNKAVAQEVVRKNKSTWEIKLDPVGTRGGVYSRIVYVGSAFTCTNNRQLQ